GAEGSRGTGTFEGSRGTGTFVTRKIRCASYIAPSPGDYIPDTSHRIIHVAARPRDQVQVNVHDGLASSFPHVDPDVIPFSRTRRLQPGVYLAKEFVQPCRLLR